MLYICTSFFFAATGEVYSATKPSLIPRGQTLIPRGQTETAEPAPVFVEVEGLPRLKPSEYQNLKFNFK